MKIIVIIDEENGILFNNRRVSKDRYIIDDILNSYKKIYIDEFSSDLIDGIICNINDTKDDNYYLIENIDIKDYKNIDEIIIYNFNRLYPSDFKFEFDLSNYYIRGTSSFEGYSHDKITKTIYKRKY